MLWPSRSYYSMLLPLVSLVPCSDQERDNHLAGSVHTPVPCSDQERDNHLAVVVHTLVPCSDQESDNLLAVAVPHLLALCKRER